MHVDIDTLASYCIVGTALVGVLGFLWERHTKALQHWFRDEMAAYLRNDDTTIARYQHQTRDEVRQVRDSVSEVRDSVREMHSDVRDIQGLVLNHVMDRKLHGGE